MSEDHHTVAKIYGPLDDRVTVVCSCGDEIEGADVDDAMDRHDADLAAVAAPGGLGRARAALADATARKTATR